ncbi:helix-turn-helix transcriptional regulator [Streptomyces sp. SP17KL33]|uniref:helix-turn-helix transcriptional regulator n=1 Tax=Streptomyces sp. SP17KL33 TaxID=3002534 RepID=UPI002E79B957|nr:AAA family ATPase [Streptomyces sp. SP17KL33]MEE1836807.1 AAA family ATPase [Streptomyces sp. SP17KL33]
MAEAYDGPGRRAGMAPFVSRSVEIALLDSVLERLGVGGPAVVDVTGEAGIGKSRLLAELCARARRRGLTVLRGWAAEYEQHSPFRPFADAFADLDARALRALPVLAELPPVLRGDIEGPGGPGAGAGAGDRFGLYQATAAVLGRIGGAGLVVVLDDLHWADPASLELLGHLVRHPVPAPLLLVVSRRDRQAPATLATALADGVDTGAVLRLALGPLGERDCVEELADDLPQPQAAELYAASEGNPLYFLALLQAHRGARLPRTPFSTPPAPASYGGPDGLPAGLEALLLTELSPLSPMERLTVEASAVLGDHATPAMIGALTDSDVTDVIPALDQVMRRDLVRPGQGGRRLALRHPLIRTLVHESITPWRREELHRRAAAELARAGASVVERAHHLEQSLTRWDLQAATVLTEAAEQTTATAPATSAHWLEVVLRLLPDTSEHLARRRRLMLLRARALGVSGGLKESRDLLHQVIDMPGTDADADAVRTSAVVHCSLVERHLGGFAECEAMLRRELARSPGRPRSQTIDLRLELGFCGLMSAVRFPDMRSEVAEALTMARSLGDEIREMRALSLAAMGEAYDGDVAAARRFAEPAARLADALTDNDLAALCESLCVLGWAEAFLESYADAARHADRGLDIARRTGQLYLLPQILVCKAYIDLTACRITPALELVEEAAAIARALGSGELLAFALAFRAQILLQARPQGDPGPLDCAEEAVAAAGTNDSWWASLAWCMLAYAALSAGDPHRVPDLLLRAGGGSGLRRLQPSVRPTYLELLVTAAVATGDVEKAERWAERAHKEAEQLGLPAQRGAALRSLAQVAAHRGDTAAAARMFAEAAADSAGAGAVLREAQSLLLGAPLMKAAGDGSRAAVMWRRGSRLASAGGAQLLADLAERVRPAVLGGPSRMSEPVGGLTALTAREREVAGLVAEGLTNQTIATRLYLSPRTVESHVARVYRKTGVSSRAALASLVARSGAASRAPDGT